MAERSYSIVQAISKLDEAREIGHCVERNRLKNHHAETQRKEELFNASWLEFHLPPEEILETEFRRSPSVWHQVSEIGQSKV